MSGGWHRHGPRLHQGAADLCSAAPDGTPVLVVDMAGAREQIARALWVRRWGTRPFDPESLAGLTCLAEAGSALAALGAPEEGRS